LPVLRTVVPLALSVIALAAPIATQRAFAQDASVTLPQINIISSSPLPAPRRPPQKRAATAPTTAIPTAPAAPQSPAPAVPGAVDADKVPANVRIVPAADFDHATASDLLSALARDLPGVSLGDQTGNQFQLDLNYRGFISSPLIGTPQGLAVYQNGVRINEVFGDVVNWDFIPGDAIRQITLVPSNPVYGLNAIGGALSFEMKNGFTYQGVETELSGGSFGRIGASMQAGGQVGNLSGYVAADAINDAGWRQFSPSQIRRLYADLGARGDDSEFHVTFTAADNNFGAAAATPMQLLAQDWSSVYTVSQTTQNQLAFLTASAAWKPTDTLAYQAVVYYRNFRQFHVDGNGTDACTSSYCPDTNNVNPCPPGSNVCFRAINGSGYFDLGYPSSLGSDVLGEIDRTWTNTNSFGGSAQVASSADLFGHGNNFVLGLSVDRGFVQFAESSELGTVNPNTFPFVDGLGFLINAPAGDVAPVQMGAQTLYTGVYASDTFDVTNRLAVTAGARFNIAQIALTDQLGNDPALNGSHGYNHFNPMIGATYKLTPNLTLYGDYAIANRAPTPLELGCSDPTRPCLIDNALVGDPPLRQVVTYAGEAGLRGHFGVAGGQLNWTLGAYRALNTNDIIDVASPIPGFESFQNAGDTLRQGIEANASYRAGRWNLYASYTSVEATFRDYLTLSSPNNPFADANSNIFVVPGDHLAGIPDYRFKTGADYQITDAWKLGADLNIIGSQYLVGDESNQNPKVPAYWVVNLHSSYKVSEHVELFGLVNNLFDRHYDVYGAFFQANSFPYLNLTDPRTFVPGMPFAAYAGIRARL
jgi:iron complex outermembrane receptor protein